MLSIEFLTQSPNGSILYNGPLNIKQNREDFFSLQLLNGRLLIDLDFGNSGIDVRRHLKSSPNLADGKWHTIEIRQLSTIDHLLEVLIDYCPVTGGLRSSGECRFMIGYNEDDVFSTNQPLQLGGVALDEKQIENGQLPMEYMGNFKGKFHENLDRNHSGKFIFRLYSKFALCRRALRSSCGFAQWSIVEFTRRLFTHGC